MTTDLDSNADTSNEAGDRSRKGAGDRVRSTVGSATRAASDAYGSAREKTSALYGSARERASSALEATRLGAERAGQRTADEIDASPIAAVLGGMAIGAVAAVLLPRTQREAQAFGGIGTRLGDMAREAARSAKEAGRGRLEELGYNTDAATEKLGEIAGNLTSAVGSSAAAAARGAKGKGRK
jgi:ElaB/YqjD/DUF883 family membrane-anchored ribosome-binding protein